MSTVSRPEVKNTVSHRFATDTAIAWQSKNPQKSAPPTNVPLFPGQLIAVLESGTTCKLYVGSEDQSRWIAVV